jgi:ABC-type uncharacterized transport system permease subunit
MAQITVLAISALLALVPASILPFRTKPRRDATFWTLLAVAAVGPLVWLSAAFAPGWRTGLSGALIVTVAATLLIYAGLAASTREAWRLTPLLLPYLILTGIIALIWQDQPERPLADTAPSAWIVFHVLVSVVSYGLLTIGAVAGLAVFLQERALKSKRPGALTRILPSVADSEELQVRLLAASAVVLGIGIASGMTTQYFETGAVLSFSHKIAFSILTFVVLVVLLWAHYRTGMRGRRAARGVLLAWLLLTLAYPGVKFVTDVLLS